MISNNKSKKCESITLIQTYPGNKNPSLRSDPLAITLSKDFVIAIKYLTCAPRMSYTYPKCGGTYSFKITYPRRNPFPHGTEQDYFTRNKCGLRENYYRRIRNKNKITLQANWKCILGSQESNHTP